MYCTELQWAIKVAWRVEVTMEQTRVPTYQGENIKTEVPSSTFPPSPSTLAFDTPDHNITALPVFNPEVKKKKSTFFFFNRSSCDKAPTEQQIEPSKSGITSKFLSLFSRSSSVGPEKTSMSRPLKISAPKDFRHLEGFNIGALPSPPNKSQDHESERGTDSSSSLST